MPKPPGRAVQLCRLTPHASQKALVALAIQRRLRRDLGLNSSDIDDIDIDLALECGLLSPPPRRAV